MRCLASCCALFYFLTGKKSGCGMANYICPMCGSEVVDNHGRCPSCGCPLDFIQEHYRTQNLKPLTKPNTSPLPQIVSEEKSPKYQETSSHKNTAGRGNSYSNYTISSDDDYERAKQEQAEADFYYWQEERREFLEWENTYWQYLWENSDEPFNVEGIEFFKEDNIEGMCIR